MHLSLLFQKNIKHFTFTCVCIGCILTLNLDTFQIKSGLLQ